jgi:transposase
VDTILKSKKKDQVFMSPKKRRLFTAEQKADAVRIVEQSDKPLSQIAKKLGISESTLRKWVNQTRVDENGAPISVLKP